MKMHIETDKKERKIVFSFGTAKLEKEMLDYIHKYGKKIMKAVNNLHGAIHDVNEANSMKIYGLKKTKKETNRR